jgi:hypothetical protein
MDRQIQLIEDTEWDVLIVLDACRYDAFARVCARGARCVRSSANNTAGWIKNVGPMLADRHVQYVSANPVVERSICRYDMGEHGLETIPVWEALWGRHTEDDIPSVHPEAVNGAVWAGCSYERPIVVHYLQPHSPYIGEPHLGMARWGRAKDGLYAACHRLDRPDRAAQRGEVDWETVREAYDANLRLVWRSVGRLVEALREGLSVVITADHGEVLGEHGGKFGHEGNWHYKEIHEVPWLPMRSAKGMDDAKLHDHFEALGYV